ncbi:MAG: T9SS type A sorting domain-containing protein [Flavobacteriales bacterium]
MRLLVYLLILFPFFVTSQNTWSSGFDAVRSYSSPRATDLNSDGVDDIILGAGTDGFASPYGAIALDGVDGSTLWLMQSTNEIFSSPIHHDFNGDNIDDVVVAGRDAELRLIDGSDGSLIWKFWNYSGVHPNDSGWYNFYSPQIIEDLNNDGISDLLCANGGDHSLDAFEFDRPPGQLLFIDGANGQVLNQAFVPDSNETYMSPLVVDINQGSNLHILFGTGGETIEGNLWLCDFEDLLNEDLSNAVPLLENTTLGLIAPPSISDLNNDNVLDIVCQTFEGRIAVIDGSSLELLWDFHMPNTESSASAILGNFTPSDNYTDVFATLYGGAQSSYSNFYQVLLDGHTGEVLFMDSIGDFNFATPVAFDSNNDGNDEVLISTTNMTDSFIHELVLIDFVTSTQSAILSTSGGDVWSSPLIQDIDGDGLLDIISVTQNNNPFVSDGITIYRTNTSYAVPEKGISWGSYLGNNYNGHFESFFKDCQSSNSLFLYPSEACPNENSGSINLLATNSAATYSYSWSNGVVEEDLDNLAVGEYLVIVTDTNGCQAIASTQVEEFVTTSFAEDASIYGASDGWAYFNVSGCNCNSSNCQYSWYLNDSLIVQGNGSTASQTYKYLYDLSAGTYQAEIIMPNGCVVTEEIIVGQPLVYGCTDPSAGNYNPDATMDDGSCHSPLLSCDITPTGLYVDNIIHNRIVFNWSAPSAAPSHYMIRYREVGTSSWTVMSAGPVNSNAFTGTSRTRYFMEPGTTYQWNIRARVLNEDGSTSCQSPWSVSSEYTTLDACANLENLSASTEAVWATLSADAPDASWGVWQSKGKMRVVGTNSFRYVNGAADGSISVLKGNFEPSTDYEWHTKAWCTGNVDANGDSDPQYHSGWGDFSTFSTQAPCDKMPNNFSTSANGAQTAITMSWSTPESGQPDHYFLELTNVTTGQVWAWNNLAGSLTSKTKFGLTAGDYSWRIRGACGANGTSWATIFSQPVEYTLGAARLANLSNLKIYPNPSSDIFHLDFYTYAQTEIRLYSLLGEQVYRQTFSANSSVNTIIDLSDYAKGLYKLSVITSEGIANFKLVKQ